MLRTALVGCGFIAPYHAAAWAELPEVEVTAVVDPDLAAAERLRDRFAPRARVHASLDDALADGGVELVDILSPPGLHDAHARAALAAGLPTICQKPLTDDLATARALARDFAAAGVPLAVHENHAFRPWFTDLADRHTRGGFGVVQLLRIEQYDATSPPQAGNRDAAHGVLLNYGIHLLDLAVQLLGGPRRVEARLWRGNPEVRGESLAIVRLEYPDGPDVQIGAGWKAGGLALGGLTLLGTDGEADYRGTMTRGPGARWRVTRGSETLIDEVRRPDDDYAAAFLGFQRAVVDHLLRDAPLPQPASRNLVTLATTFAAYASAERGTPVDLTDLEDPR